MSSANELPFDGANSVPAVPLPPAALDDAQRELFLLEHLPQVRHVARRIHDRLPPNVPIEDLVHAGIIGLMDAIRKYDPARNIQLKHYAEFRIRGAILDSLRDLDWGPRRLRRQGRRLQKSIADCKARFGHEPSETEIAADLHMSLLALQQLRAELRNLKVTSLQLFSSQSDGREVARPDRAASEEDDPFRCALRSEMGGMLAKAIEQLPAREREVLALYHYEELTMKEVGEVLGIGESRVSQIHTTAMPRLRERLRLMLVGHPAAQKVSNSAA